MELNEILQCKAVVACDTTVIRTLCYDPLPPWLDKFKKMSEDGFRFCLADHAIAEFINQVIQGNISFTEWKKAIEHTDSFISKELPVLPGKRILLPFIGKTDINGEVDKDFLVVQAKACWDFIKQTTEENLQDDVIFEYQSTRHKINFMRINEDLEKERQKWRELILSDKANYLELGQNERMEILKHGPGLDSDVDCNPLLSVRLDFALKHLDRVLMNTKYNPDASKKRNDGIDYNMGFVFMLKCLLCTNDRNYYETLANNIDSFQSYWIYSAEKLADTWSNDNLNLPEWPES